MSEKKNIYFISLGCDKNLVDSEVMLGLLDEAGYAITDDENEADVIIVNTCGFIKDAQEESVETVLEMAELKKQGRCKVLIAAGCMAQRYKEEIFDEIEEVDAVVGTASYQNIVRIVDEIMGDDQADKKADFESLSSMAEVDVHRMLTAGTYSSYLKIAEGCDKHCSYCIIPKLRGNFRSFSMDYLVRQAEDLARRGVKELNLVAQETTVYGIDLYGEKKLPQLLRRLCAIDGIEWIRILYCYPEEITDELIQVIGEEKKICHYLDLPIQHAHDTILKRMGRRTDRAQLESIIAKLRKAIPDIALRTTLITGFPGETQEMHESLCDFISAMQFDRLGVFTYSPEDGTPAALMPNQIDEEVKEARRDELMALQQGIAFKKAEDMVGRQVKVLVEGRIPEDNVYIGRTYKDAPNVDGFVFVHAEEEMMSGDLVDVLITDARDYDLIGDVIYEFTE